ncbi:MAG: TIM barrel protein, partial [Candidatus Bathyarchaeia archaeon]
DLELGTAGLSTSVLKKCLNISMLTNARLVRVYPNKKEPIIEIVERLRSFSPILRSKGITLAIENSSLCLYTSRQLAEIIRKAKSPHIGACVDVVNSIGLLEKPIETVKILSQYAVSLHVKDYRIKRNNAGGFTIYGVPLGKGMLDLRGILKIFKHKGQEPNILLEQFMSQKENIAKTLREEERWIKEGIKHLKLSIKKE